MRALALRKNTPGGRGRNEMASRTGYDMAAEHYRQVNGDPYAKLVEEQRNLGMRYPRAYDAAAEAARRTPGTMPARTGSRTAFFGAPSVAGSHVNDHGELGRFPGQYVERWSDSRMRAGALEQGGRSPGLATVYDIASVRRRDSGRIVGTGSMSQTVDRERPWFALRCTGSAEVTVLVGMTGGYQQTRTFFLGGGFTAAFCLSDYDSVKMSVDLVDTPTTEVQFGWVSTGLQSGNVGLFLPQVVDAGMIAIAQAVPEGAYQVSVKNNDPTWTWRAPALPGYVMGPGGAFPGVLGAQTPGGVSGINPVLGSTFTPQIAPNYLLWYLRPI